MNQSRIDEYIKLYKNIPFKHLVWIEGVTRQCVTNYKTQTRTGEIKASLIEKNINEAVAFMEEYDSLKFTMTDKIRINTASYFLAVEYNELYKGGPGAEPKALVRRFYDEHNVQFKKMLIRLVLKRFE